MCEFFYAVVSKNGTPVADFEQAQGNYQKIAKDLIPKLQEGPSLAFEQGDFIFSAQMKDNLGVIVLSKKSVDAKKRFFAVSEIMQKWTARYGSASFSAYSKSDEFGGEIQKTFNQLNNPSQSKIDAINSNIQATNEVMTQTLATAIQRSEKLEVLEDKAENIKNSANNFQRQATQVRRQMCCEKYKWWIIIGVVVVVVVAIIVIICCCV